MIPDRSLISTALLALQQSGEFLFNTTSSSTFKTGFLQTVLVPYGDADGEFLILVYIDPQSPTGYSIQIQAVAMTPSLPILERQIENYQDFENLIETDYSNQACEVTRRWRSETGIDKEQMPSFGDRSQKIANIWEIKGLAVGKRLFLQYPTATEFEAVFAIEGYSKLNNCIYARIHHGQNVGTQMHGVPGYGAVCLRPSDLSGFNVTCK